MPRVVRGTGERVVGCGVDAVRALDASKASVSDYYIHTYEARPVEWQQDCAGMQISTKRDEDKSSAEIQS
jgi:hypothetical protein